jgi:hypothetical protein
MSRRPRKPPPAIVQAHVLEYAVLPRSLPFAGDSSIAVGKAGGPLLPLERVPRLVICRRPEGGIQLTFCNGRWQYVASTGHKTVAKQRAGPRGSIRARHATGPRRASRLRTCETTWSACGVAIGACSASRLRPN